MKTPTAEIVARAIVGAARQFGRDPVEIMGAAANVRPCRALAGAALERAGYGPRPLLQRACGLGSSTYFFPSQWKTMHFTAAQVERVARDIEGAA